MKKEKEPRYGYEDTSPIRMAVREISSGSRNIKVAIRTWNALKRLKKPGETFNDVILSLLRERSEPVGGDGMKAIRYARKKVFAELEYSGRQLGVEFDYNDSKGQEASFSLDLKVKKVFFGNKALNPSEFFGVDNTRKHLNRAFLYIYLKCVGLALQKEFRIAMREMSYERDYENIALWKKIYYEHSLSEDSFISDVEEPLRMSDEKPGREIKERIKSSLSGSAWNLAK